MMPIVTPDPQIDVDEMQEAVLTADEMTRLQALAELYPALELFSRAEIGRLAFVRWQHDHRAQPELDLPSFVDD